MGVGHQAARRERHGGGALPQFSAGKKDTFRDCCLIETARAFASAAAASNAPLELVTYPNVGHDFIVEGRYYDGKAAEDAWSRTAAMLKQYLTDAP